MNLLTWLSFLSALGVFMIPVKTPLKPAIIGLLCVPGSTSLAIAYHKHQNRLFQEGEKVDALLELEQEIDRLQCELKQLEPEKQRVTELIKEAALAQEQLQRQREEHLQQLQEDREDQLKQLAAAHKQLDSERNEYMLYIDLEQRKLYAERQRQEVELDALKQAAQTEIQAARDILEAEIQADRSRLEALREGWTEERQRREEVREEEFLNYLEGVKREVLEELAANYESDVQQEVRKRIDGEVDPLLHKIRELESTIKIQQQKIIALDNRIQELDDIELPKGTGHSELTATKVLLFYKSKGLKLKYVSSQFLADGMYLFTCLPHRTTNMNTEKFSRAVAAQFLLLQSELQLQVLPQMATTSDGLQLLMKPQNLPNWQQKIDKTAVIQDAEIVDYLPEHLTEYAQNVYEESDNNNYMLRFRPSNQFFDRRQPVSDLERTTIDWYWNWRNKATGQPTIRNKNELIRLIYGVKPGRATDQLDESGQTLRERLNSILDELGITHRVRR